MVKKLFVSIPIWGRRATGHLGADRSRFILQIKKSFHREAIHWNRIRARRLSDGSSPFDRANQVRNGVMVP
ncbi:hypothetical protein AB4Z43_29810 [Mesorhizobium sp. 2RAF45]|uniref:hypothetical protein n=1 Tax=unclassified Mesorhizobium TaxID=325217 RepID=UPI0013E06A5E|nr:hypothetical protein [Mesorhizobium sp. M7D.F.Ca.US.004.01.2.1]